VQRIGTVRTCVCDGEIHSICVLENSRKHYHGGMRGFRRKDIDVGSRPPLLYSKLRFAESRQ